MSRLAGAERDVFGHHTFRLRKVFEDIPPQLCSCGVRALNGHRLRVGARQFLDANLERAVAINPAYAQASVVYATLERLQRASTAEED